MLRNPLGLIVGHASVQGSLWNGKVLEPLRSNHVVRLEVDDEIVTKIRHNFKYDQPLDGSSERVNASLFVGCR